MTSDLPKYPFLQLPNTVVDQLAIPIMLTIYKYGIAEIPSDMGLLKMLAAEKLMSVHLARGHSVCTLTDLGAEWVNKNLFSILVNCPLSLSYPAIIPKDEIQLMADIVRHSGSRTIPSFVGPSSTMDRGRYFLQQIVKSRIIVIDDCSMPYQLNLVNTENLLRFRGDQLGTLDEELKKRFHKIRIKSLVKRLAPMVSTLTLTEWVEELYNKSYTKWRMGD